MATRTRQETIEGWMAWAGDEKVSASSGQLCVEWSLDAAARGLVMVDESCRVCGGFVDQQSDLTVAFCDAEGNVEMYHDGCIHE